MGSTGKAGAGQGGQLPPPEPPEKKQKGLDGNATIQEVKAYYKDNFKVDIPDNIAEKLGRYNMIESAQQLDKLFSMLPEEAKQFIPELKMTFNAHGGAYASASYTDNGLNVNKNFFGKGRHDKLKEQYEQDVKSKWHPDGTNYADILVHEMAHHIEYNLTKNKLVGNNNPFGKSFSTIISWNDQVYSKQVVEEAYKDMKKAGEANGMTTKQARLSISRYADVKKGGKQNYHETIAEAVADIVRNGDKAKPFSKHVWNNFTALMK